MRLLGPYALIWTLCENVGEKSDGRQAQARRRLFTTLRFLAEFFANHRDWGTIKKDPPELSLC